MKITIMVMSDYPWRSGGVNQAVHNLATFLADRGHDVEVFALDSLTQSKKPVVEVHPRVVVRPVPSGLRRLGAVPILGGVATLLSVLLAPRVMAARMSRGNRPAVILAEFTCAETAIRWGDGANVPVIVLRWAHWADELSRTGRLFRFLAPYWKHREEWVFRHAECIAVDGPDIRDDLISQGVQESRVRLVPGSVDVELFGGAAPSRRALAGLDTENKRIVLFPSMLRDIKGFDHLLRAFASLPEHLRRSAVVVATGRQDQTRYRVLADELGVGRDVIFTGEVASAELPPLFAAASIAVFPYLFGAGYSVAGIEAMAAGLPLVAYDVQAFDAVVEEGVTGFLVPVGDTEALSKAIGRLLEDEALRARMGIAARARVRDFSIDAVGMQYQGIIEKIASGEACE